MRAKKQERVCVFVRESACRWIRAGRNGIETAAWSRVRKRELYPPALAAAALGRLSKPCLGGFGAQIEIIPHSEARTHTQRERSAHRPTQAEGK